MRYQAIHSREVNLMPGTVQAHGQNPGPDDEVIDHSIVAHCR